MCILITAIHVNYLVPGPVTSLIVNIISSTSVDILWQKPAINGNTVTLYYLVVSDLSSKPNLPQIFTIPGTQSPLVQRVDSLGKLYFYFKF